MPSNSRSGNSGDTSPENKAALFEHPIHELIAKRQSKRAFSSKPVDTATLASLLEAARWAASCANDQPWSFIVTEKNRPSGYDRLLGCLVEFNFEWAQHAPVLILSVARLNFANGKPNRHAWHDVGEATAQLVLQAAALGLTSHQMAGFDIQKARDAFAIPQGYDTVTVIAIGYPGDPASLSDKLRERELAPRQRKPLQDFVFSGTWGERAGSI